MLVKHPWSFAVWPPPLICSIASCFTYMTRKYMKEGIILISEFSHVLTWGRRGSLKMDAGRQNRLLGCKIHTIRTVLLFRQCAWFWRPTMPNFWFCCIFIMPEIHLSYHQPNTNGWTSRCSIELERIKAQDLLAFKAQIESVFAFDLNSC